MKRFPLLIVAASLLSFGCASGPLYKDVKSSLPPVPQDNGRIFFYRPSGVGAAVQPKVHLNEGVVGVAKPLGVYYVDTPPGNYKVATHTEVTREASFVLDKGQTRYVRFGISFGFFVGHVFPELVEADQAQKEMDACHYIGTLPQGSAPMPPPVDNGPASAVPAPMPPKAVMPAQPTAH